MATWADWERRITREIVVDGARPARQRELLREMWDDAAAGNRRLREVVQVFLLDKQISAWLGANDPQALKQATAALGASGGFSCPQCLEPTGSMESVRPCAACLAMLR